MFILNKVSTNMIKLNYALLLNKQFLVRYGVPEIEIMT